MGELLICHEPIAALPFYVEGAGVNLYSMEELCYYIAGNTYLLDRSFMSEELCTWIERELGLYKLAEQLRDISSLSEFVRTILDATAYQSPGKIGEIVATVRQIEEKSDFECRKLRADQLMKKKKYLSSIYEYKRLLDSGESASALLVGAIWHNLGTANARLFLFEEAAHCYRMAYEHNQSGDSLRAYLLAVCLRDPDDFRRQAEEHHLDETEIQELVGELSPEKNETESAGVLPQALDGEDSSRRAEIRQELSGRILEWKEDYRKSCRM